MTGCKTCKHNRKWEHYCPKCQESEGMSEMNDIFQVDYLPEKKEIRINLPEGLWNSIDTVTLTRLFQEELVIEKQKEIEGEEVK